MASKVIMRLGILMAAGASSRMGSSKPLLPWMGTSLICWELEILRSCKVDQIVVVLGSNHLLVAQEIQEFNCSIVVNKNWSSGSMPRLKQTNEKSNTINLILAWRFGDDLVMFRARLKVKLFNTPLSDNAMAEKKLKRQEKSTRTTPKKAKTKASSSIASREASEAMSNAQCIEQRAHARNAENRDIPFTVSSQIKL